MKWWVWVGVTAMRAINDRDAVRIARVVLVRSISDCSAEVECEGN
jgi:hypothetical protein